MTPNTKDPYERIMDMIHKHGKQHPNKDNPQKSNMTENHPTPNSQQNNEVPTPKQKYNHYFKEVVGIDSIDVYAVLTLWDVRCPAVAHAIKKLLCSGQRGAKNRETDLMEAADSIKRAIELHNQFNNSEK